MTTALGMIPREYLLNILYQYRHFPQTLKQIRTIEYKQNNYAHGLYSVVQWQYYSPN